MDRPLINNLKRVSQGIISLLADGNTNRIVLLDKFNEIFKEFYKRGFIDRICQFSICDGDERFKSNISAAKIRSGLELKFLNSANLQIEEVLFLASIILGNERIVRDLIIMGFDTFRVSTTSTSEFLVLPIAYFSTSAKTFNPYISKKELKKGLPQSTITEQRKSQIIVNTLPKTISHSEQPPARTAKDLALKHKNRKY